MCLYVHGYYTCLTECLYIVIAVSPCLNITNVTLNEYSVTVTYEVTQGYPDTVSLDYSTDNVIFYNISPKISSSLLIFTVNGTFSSSQTQFFKMRAFEKGFASFSSCSLIYQWSPHSNPYGKFILVKFICLKCVSVIFCQLYEQIVSI